MSGETGGQWPWGAILTWLWVGVVGGLVVGLLVVASLLSLAMRYLPPVRPAEQMEAVERVFEDLTP